MAAIPPLSTLTMRKSQFEFIHQVTQGTPVLMGTPPLLYRGRMPVFYYLSEEEAADVYLYLTLYPPSEQATSAPLMAAAQEKQRPSGKVPGSPKPSFVLDSRARGDTESTRSADLQMAALPWAAAFVTLLLAGGLLFTFREFKRLSAESAGRDTMVRNFRMKPGMARPTPALAQGAGTWTVIGQMSNERAVTRY